MGRPFGPVAVRAHLIGEAPYRLPRPVTLLLQPRSEAVVGVALHQQPYSPEAGVALHHGAPEPQALPRGAYRSSGSGSRIRVSTQSTRSSPTVQPLRGVGLDWTN